MKRMKQWTACLMLAALLCAALAGPASAEPAEEPSALADPEFCDVPADAWYAPAVIWALGREITRGTDDSHFSPDRVCTRAEAITFLWRTFGRQEPQHPCGFADVDPAAYYASAVRWAAESGIAYGVDETRFAPDDPCTRAEFMAFLWRAANPAPCKDDTDGPLPFADVPADAWYAREVAWAVRLGVTDGVDETHFAPDAPCTRAQAVTFLRRWAVAYGLEG